MFTITSTPTTKLTKLTGDFIYILTMTHKIQDRIRKYERDGKEYVYIPKKWVKQIFDDDFRALILKSKIRVIYEPSCEQDIADALVDEL